MSKKAVLRTAQDIFVLDKAFFLIEGHPSDFRSEDRWDDGILSVRFPPKIVWDDGFSPVRFPPKIV
jgi:hypothetical protein